MSLMLVSACGVLCAGCYHVTVVTGAPPAPTVIDKQWQLSWVAGIVPPPEISTKEQCAQGVAKVETERSSLNGSPVGGITYNIFTPMHAMVTCASGPVAKAPSPSADNGPSTVPPHDSIPQVPMIQPSTAKPPTSLPR